MIRFAVIAILSMLITACSPYKYYAKTDFSFYQEGFSLQSSLPKTQGVYVLDKVYTKRYGYVADHQFKGYSHFYKFFKTGQHNSYLVQDKDFDGNYQRIVQEAKTGREGGRTLFQGYYKLQSDHIILEGVNAALGKFHYTHGKIYEDRLEIISTGSDDVAHFDAGSFNYLSVYTYVFKPFDIENYQDVKIDW